jgi:hypothetical protein
LTVQVADEQTAEQAQQLLQSHGFQIIDRLKLAPNLFVVKVPAGHDSVDAAQRLAASAEVKFAEPELIEMIPGR